MEDGEELSATFLSSNQNSGENPSSHIKIIHSLLTKAISRGAVDAKDSTKHLLRQLCRGCWDQSLIVDLLLEHQKNNPPFVSELLFLMRAKEDRRAAKLERKKNPFGRASYHTF